MSVLRPNCVAIGCVFAMLSSPAAMAQDDPGPKPSLRPPKIVRPGLPDSESPKSGDQLVRVQAFADVHQVVPGQKFLLAFVLQIEPHWHIYWKNSGASGGATTVQVTGPGDFTIGKTLYPRPIAMTGEEGVSYGYEDKTVLYVEVTAPELTTAGSATFTARINWMVCKDICLLGKSTQRVTVMVSDGSTPPAPALKAPDPAVSEFKSRLPQPLEKLQGAAANFDGHVLTIKLPAQGKTTAQFFPLEMPGVSYEQANVKAEDDWIAVSVPVHVNPNDSLGQEMRIAGTIGLGDRPTDPSFEIDLALPEE